MRAFVCVSIAFRKGELNFLITHGNDYCIGHDPLTGKEQWRVAGLNPKNQYNRTLRFVASPVASQGLLVVPSAKNRGFRWSASPKPKAGSRRVGRVSFGEWIEARPTSRRHCFTKASSTQENGTILCLDALTGEQFYQERFHAQTYRGSPVAANGRIFLTARDGTFTVLKAGKNYEVIGKNKLDDQFTASPVIAHDRLYLRGYRSLYAIAAQ